MCSDFELFLKEYGFTPELVSQISTNTTDVKPFEFYCGVGLGDSFIHGTGLFAEQDFEGDILICPGRLVGFRTPAGRYMNHSPNPNCIGVDDYGGNIFVKSLRNIKKGEELTLDYRQSVELAKKTYSERT